MTHILFVDDEPLVLNSLRRALRPTFHDLGVTPHYTTSPGEAIKMAEEEKGNIALVVSDHNMPNMLGTSLLDRVKDIDPSISCLLLTGNSSVGESQSRYKVVSKPWDHDELCDLIRECVSMHYHRKGSEQAQKPYK